MEVGLIFGIIFAAIVMGLLIFFGFRYISDMISISCESQVQQQAENLKNVAKSTLALSKDSAQEFKIIIQSNCVSRMCFVNTDNPQVENNEWGWIPSEFLTTMVSRYGYNVIITRPDGAIDGYQIDKLKPSVNFCLTSTKEVTLRNAGKTVDVTLPEFG
jgi:hypothetical protein